MPKALATSTAIRSALADDYRWLIASFDPKYRERRATAAIRRRLDPWRCAACGRTPPDVADLQAAHIAPLQECAPTTADNIVPLCVQPRASPPTCHSLFDHGCASIEDMEAARVTWATGGTSTLRERMLAVFERYVDHPQQRGHLTKQLSALRVKLASLQPTSTEWHQVQLTIAEVVRRRARDGALEHARRELQCVDPNRLQPRERARFHYEQAYVSMLLGDIRAAFLDFDGGRAVLADVDMPGNGWRRAAHTALVAQVSRIMSSHGVRGGWSWNRVRDELTIALKTARDDLTALQSAGEAPEAELRNASRWIQNCLLDLVKPDIAQRRFKQAHKRLADAAQRWRTMDITRGWDAGFRPTLLSLYGQITLGSATSDEDIRIGMSYFVRGMALLLGLRRQQPEGIRDILFGIADGLRRLQQPVRGGRITAVAERIVEYSSWFNPPTPKRPEVSIPHAPAS